MPKSLRVALPLLLIALGVLSLVAAGRSIFTAFRQDGTLMQAPGKKTISIEKPGNYTLWIQNRGAIEGKLLSFPIDLPSGATVEVSRTESGETIPLDSNAAATVTINDVMRKAVGSVNITEPGQITVAVSDLDTPRLFYFSESFSFTGFFGAMSLIFTGGCMVLAGIGIGLYFLLRPAPHQYHTLQPPR